MTLMGIAVFLVPLLFVVGVHEFGHLAMGRLLGVPARVFAIGFGPTLLSKMDRRGTRWSLKALPFGGYVEFDTLSFEMAKPWKKALISFAGPAVNLFCAMIAFGIIGMNAGGLLGMVVAVGLFFTDVVSYYWLLLVSIWHLLTTGSLGGFSGPVGMAHTSSTMTQSEGWLETMADMFIGLSMGLGVLNLLPIPILDGGNIVLAFIEMIAGNRRAMWVRRRIAPIAFVTLLIFGIVINAHDLLHL